MIKSVRIKNFQGVEDIFIEFSDGVNFIIGPTDSGKSTIIRAVEWVRCNRAPKSFQRLVKDTGTSEKAEGPTEVIIETSEYYITRKCDDKVNCYIIKDKKTQKVTRIDAVGRGPVPPEITKCLGMGDINVQKQGVGSFLLWDTPGFVGKELNKIIDLEIMNTLPGEVSSKIKLMEKDIKNIVFSIKGFESEVYNYKDLDLKIAEFDTLEAENKKNKKRADQIRELEVLIDDTSTILDKIKDYQDLFEKEQDLNEIIKLTAEASAKRIEVDEVSFLVREIQSNLRLSKEFTGLADKESELDVILEKMKSSSAMSKEMDKLSHLIQGVVSIKKGISEMGTKILELSDLFDLEMPEICPLCGK